MGKNTRGFIPLVAIVLLGLVAVAGGAIAAFSIHNKTASKETLSAVVATSTPEQAATTTEAAYSTPVQARVQSSGAGTTQSAPEAPSTPVTQISATLDADTKTICDETGSSDPMGISLWCKELETPGPDTSDQQERWTNLATRVKSAWKIQQQQHNLDTALQRAQSNNTSGGSNAYDNAQCTAQKQALIAQADQTYLTWYAQWQDARKGIDACYSTNSVPVCDKQMTELNVEWQDKLTAQFNGLHDQLTSCAPDNRHFNDVSSVVAAPY